MKCFLRLRIIEREIYFTLLYFVANFRNKLRFFWNNRGFFRNNIYFFRNFEILSFCSR